MHALHLLARALHIDGAHLPRDIPPLFLGDRCQALGLEEIDTGAFVAEVGFQADEDEGGGRAEVEDFGVPLHTRILALDPGKDLARIVEEGGLTLSMTFSRELGQSMAKHTKRRSVSGYESGLSRSYSS